VRHEGISALSSYYNTPTKKKQRPGSKCLGAGASRKGGVTMDDLDLVPLKHVQLPQTPDQRIVASFKLTSTPNNASVLAYMSINKGPYTHYETPNEKYSSLYAVASGVSTKDLPKNLNAVHIDHGKHVEILLLNEDGGEHPMHLHGHTPWIVGRGNMPLQGNPAPLKLTNPVQRDTITIPACNTNANDECVDVGYVVLRFKADNPGVWMLHCHIDWHLATGLAMLLVVGEAQLQQKGLQAFAPDMRTTCQN
jgi:iron transport multicopper oxidase